MNTSRHTTLFLVLSAVWGVSFIAIKAGLAYFPPVLYAALRYDVASVLMLGYAVVATDRPLPRTAGDWRAILISGLLMIAAYNGLLFVGERETTGAVAATVVSLGPLLTTGFARALLPTERLSSVGIVGVLLGLLGVTIIARPDPSNLLASNLVGMALIFLAVACTSLGSVLIGRVPASISTEGLVGWSMLLGAAVLHAVSLLRPSEAVTAIRWTPEAILSLLYLAVFASAFAYLVYFHLLGEVGPVQINLVSYVVPIFAAITGWLVLDEVIDAATVVGFAVVFLGFVLVKGRELRELLVDG